MTTGNWISFETDTRLLKAATVALQDGGRGGQPIVKNYNLEKYDDICYSETAKLSDNHISFIKRFIKLYKAENVVFSIPAKAGAAYICSLHNAARELIQGEICFVEAAAAAVALYQTVIGREIDSNSIVINTGFDSLSVSQINSKDMSCSDCTVYTGTGTRLIDEKLLEYINKKFRTDAFNLSDAIRIREGLYSSPSVSLGQDAAGKIDRNEFNGIFNATLGKELNEIFDAKIKAVLKKSGNAPDRIFLIGEGSSVPQLMTKLMSYLDKNNIADLQIIKGMQTPRGDFSSPTASLLGALCLASGKCDNYENTLIKTAPDSANLYSGRMKQCTNKYCKAVLPSTEQTCSLCGVDTEADWFLRCTNCGKVVKKKFENSTNNFCCYCGQHKIKKTTAVPGTKTMVPDGRNWKWIIE